MNRNHRQIGDWNAGPLGRPAVAIAALVVAMGASLARGDDPAPPEVIRVHIPAGKVTTLFPAGTPLRMMPADEWDALLMAARRGAAESTAPAGPRLLQARHQARWEQGMLIGRSEFVVGASPAEPSAVELVPWTPMLVPRDAAGPPVGALASGRAVLRVPARAPGTGGTATVSVDWKLRALPATGDRTFLLGLPGNETSVLTVELPKGWVPLGPGGYRHGPAPASREGFEVWRFHGQPGRATLRLANPGEQGPQGETLIWVSGHTEVRLGPAASPDTPDQVANWQTDWQVRASGQGVARFSARLDPGLELLGVTGPEVRQFRLDRRPEGPLVTVTLAGLEGRPAAVRFRARARIPLEGAWSVPAIAPTDAIWTGGTTTLIPDASHVIRECRERAGYRLPAAARRDEPSGTRGPEAIAFEARAPESVAELVFRQPRQERTCLVRGRLQVGRNAAPELVCRLEGLGEIRSTTELQVELSPAWTPERVSWGGREELLSWHASVQPDGSARVRVLISGTEPSRDDRVLTLHARGTGPGGRGTVPLPRVRPVGFTVLDETWQAGVDPGFTLYPVKASGLAWIDSIADDRRGAARSAVAAEAEPVLAWRWNSPAGEAVVECEELDRAARVEIRTRAVVNRDARAVVLDGEIVVQPGTGGLDALPVTLGRFPDTLDGWSFRLGADGQDLPVIALDRESRSRLGIRGTDQAGQVRLPRSATGRQRIVFNARLPWEGRGRLPLLSTPRQFFPRGAVIVNVSPGLHSRANGAGLRRIEPPLAEELMSSWVAEGSLAGEPRVADRAGAMLAHAFTYTEPDVELELETLDLTPTASTAIIREAYLTTMVGSQGRSFNRLRLLIQGDSPLSLGLAQPPGMTLLRVLVDGVSTRPTQDGPRLSIPLAPSGAGARTSTVDLDFEGSGPALEAGAALRPGFPEPELPCLGFSWELIAAPRWRLEAAADGLTSGDPKAAESWPLGYLGLRTPRWAGSRPDAQGLREETIRRLDESLARIDSEEFTFAQWFARWDTPGMPLLIDRSSLAGIGYGPRSPCLPTRVAAPGRSPSLRTLRQYGLALVPVDSTLIVTTIAESSRPGAAEQWRSAIEEAQLWGSDRADRFHSAAHWCGEVTPRPSSTGGLSDALRPPPGWTSWKFSSAGWPGPQARVAVDDVMARRLPGWGVAGAILGVLLWPRRRSHRRALLAPLAVVLGAVLLNLWLGERSGTLTAGLFAGGLIGLSYRLGLLATSGRRRERERPRAGSRQGWAGRPARSLVVRATAILPPLLLAGHDLASATGEPETQTSDPRILVLLPYEGTYDPSQPPRQVVLRQGDLRRLEGLARRKAPAPERPLILLAASHEVSWTNDRQAVIQSDLLLGSSSPEPATWKVPIARSREIAASVDGREAPVFISPGGAWAEIPIPGRGDHRLRLSRTVSMLQVGDAARLNVPLNVAPSARLTVQAPPGRWPLRDVNARGGVRPEGDGSIAAELGPVDQLDLHWANPAPGDAAAAAAGVIADNLQLWDIEPAGDLVRARVSYRGSRPLTTLRFRTDPGLLPRTVRVPGLVAATWSGPADRPVWTLQLDPPLLPPASIELEWWRPLPARPKDEKGEKADPDARPAEAPRRLPRLEPLDAERGAGLLGVRRPGHWSGRQVPVPGSEPLSDESFVNAWGPLPDDRLTLSGTTRFGPAPDVPEFRTGPVITPLKVRPALQATIDAGRLDLQLEAELDDAGDSASQLDLGVPESLVVVSVSCDGLTDWERAAPGRVRIRSDRPAAKSRRQLRLVGYLPLASDPLKPGAQPHRIPTPWIIIPGTEAGAGTLTVRSETAVELSDAPGLTLLPAVPLAPSTPIRAAAESLFRQTYRVAEPDRLGWMQWRPSASKVNVHIDGQLTLYPDAAEWTAVIRYDVLGGPLESFPLKLPGAWALGAQIEFDGGKYDQKFGELGPLTFWRINPERPAWGSRRLVLRSVLPIAPGQEIQFPEVSPLGWGRVDTHLRLVTATSSPPEMAGSNSLREVIDAGRFNAPEFWRVPGARTRVFRVARENWSLKLRAPDAPDRQRGLAFDSARVVAADVSLTLRSDGTLIGQAGYETEPRSGRFLVIEPPPAARLLWTTVDLNPVRALTSPDGRWLVPLADGGPHRVVTSWSGAQSSPVADDGAGHPTPGQPLGHVELPRVGTGRAATLVTVHAPGNRVVQSLRGDLEAVPPDRVQLERADRIAKQINEFLPQMDRRSGRDRERVGAQVIAHELALRNADCSLRWLARRGDRARRDRAERDLEVVRTARTALLDSLRDAAMDDEVDAALAYLGQSPPGNRSSTLTIAAPPTVERIRSPGEPTCLIGLTTGLDEDPTRLGLGPRPDSPPELSPERARLTLLAGLLVALCLLVGFRPDRWSTLAILFAAGLGVLAFVGGTLAAAAGLVAALLGRQGAWPRQPDGDPQPAAG